MKTLIDQYPMFDCKCHKLNGVMNHAEYAENIPIHYVVFRDETIASKTWCLNN